MSCQDVPLFPLPGDGGGGGTGSTTSVTTTTTTTTTSGTGGSGGTSTTTTTTGTGGSGGAGGSSTTGTGGADGGVTTSGTGGAGGSSVTTGAGGMGGMGTTATTTTAATTGAGGAASGTGGAGGMIDDAGAGDAVLDDAASDAIDDGSVVMSDAGSDAGCAMSLLSPALDPGIHVQVCSPIVWNSNPPTSGMHYPVWAAFKTYKAPVPRGFTVHAMEHGAIVFSYNCPSGCAADIDALQAMLDARPADPLCVAPLKNRFIITPDPLLDTQFAAAAWGYAIKGDCLDLAAIGAFIDAHYAMAPENFCFDGTDVLDPAYNLPPDCGAPPVSDAGTD
ncbi:MAG: DUF3105 domain-containing protein [Byssovorax sp.]